MVGERLAGSMEGSLRPPTRIPFVFEGMGFEYFRIWIVNILLTVITLGIYSAWAKVRRKRYIYGNTSLDGAYFEYLAKPTKILKGRALAVLFIVAYELAVRAYPHLGFIFILLLVILFPWVMNRGLKFNAVNSSHKNIRFNFKASYFQTLVNVGITGLLVPVTLGIAYPYFLYRMKRHVIEHSFFGQTPFSFNGDANGFYRIYLAVLVLILLPIFAVTVAGEWSVAVLRSPLFFLFAFFFYFLAFVYIETFQTNYILSHVAIRSHRLDSSLSLVSMASIYATNLVAIALSGGLFLPWAKIRLLRYRLEHLALIPGIGLLEFIGDEQEETGALGEEISEFFDMDIGL